MLPIHRAVTITITITIAGRLKQQALYGRSDKCPRLPGKPVSHITHLQGTSVAQDPTQAALPAFSRHPLLGTPISSLGYLAAPPLFPREPGAYPLQMSATLLSYFIFLVASHSHQAGVLSISATPESEQAAEVDELYLLTTGRREEGRKQTLYMNQEEVLLLLNFQLFNFFLGAKLSISKTVPSTYLAIPMKTSSQLLCHLHK